LTVPTETLSTRTARRLALCRAGLLKPEWTGMPRRAAGRGKRAREAAHRIIRRFGYLQLDTVSIAGARSHAIVLHSRLDGFDPVLWDRQRVQQLFGFHQILEIFKPAAQRIYGYYCLPVLAGDRLFARFDIKADRTNDTLQILSRHFEGGDGSRPVSAVNAEAASTALDRYAQALRLAAG